MVTNPLWPTVPDASVQERKKKFWYWFTDMFSQVNVYEQCALEAYSHTNKCIWCWRFGNMEKKKQLLWLSHPLEWLKGQSNSEWCFHFNCSNCSRGYRSASMHHLLFIFCFYSMFNSQTQQLGPFETLCPHHSFITHFKFIKTSNQQASLS